MKVRFSECFGVNEVKLCLRFELFARAEFRASRFRDARGRFTRFRVGAGADGGVEGCVNLCDGAVTVEGDFSYYLYAHFGFAGLNRSCNFGKTHSGSWRVATVPQLAVLRKYCNRAPDPGNCCCIEKYGKDFAAR